MVQWMTAFPLVLAFPPKAAPPAGPPDGLIVIERLELGEPAIPLASVGVAVNVYVAGVAAVPVMVQFEFSVRLEPERLPVVRAQAIVPVPPLVARAWE